ncbi:hypothetical protein P59_106 [Bacillus phage P59]|nr:hypothetical protein P59_106 [Bacillus phage P59]
MELNFKLTQDEAQKILDVLVKEPYIDVFNLIDKMKVQADEQVRAADEEKKGQK